MPSKLKSMMGYHKGREGGGGDSMRNCLCPSSVASLGRALLLI